MAPWPPTPWRACPRRWPAPAPWPAPRSAQLPQVSACGHPAQPQSQPLRTRRRASLLAPPACVPTLAIHRCCRRRPRRRARRRRGPGVPRAAAGGRRGAPPAAPLHAWTLHCRLLRLCRNACSSAPLGGQGAPPRRLPYLTPPDAPRHHHHRPTPFTSPPLHLTPGAARGRPPRAAGPPRQRAGCRRQPAPGARDHQRQPDLGARLLPPHRPWLQGGRKGAPASRQPWRPLLAAQ
jgi:hypothetical protein